MSVQTIIPPADIPWQNLANEIQDTRAAGNADLDRLELNLNNTLGGIRAGQAHAGPSAPSAPPTKQPSSIAPWVDFITQIIAYVLVFWGLVTAVHAFNPFSWGVLLGLAALTVILGGVIVRPIQGAIRYVFGAIIEILKDLVEFVGQWFNAILQYFEGDFLKAILRIVLLAAFMWLWQFAQTIPVIKNIIDFVSEGVGQVVKWVNDAFDAVTRFLEGLRRYVDDGISNIFQSMGDLGRQFTQLLTGEVDRIFTSLESRLQQVRFEILSRVDLISAALGAQITVLGVTVRVLPETARVYFRQFNQANPHQAIGDSADILARAGAGLGAEVTQLTPVWVIAEDYIAQVRTLLIGGTNGIADRADALIPLLQQLNRGEVPETPALPPEWLQIPGPGQGPPPPPAPAGRPPWVPSLDWQTVTGICGGDHVAYLAAAIGQHETNWGTTGAGRDGFILGVGVFGGVQQEQFRGLVNQLDWACPRLRGAFPGPGAVTRDAVIAFGRDVYQVPDFTGWGTDVYNLFAQVFLGTVSTLA